MPTYTGQCHCGEVCFRVTATIRELTTCDCSICTMRHALMAKVHESELQVLRGEERLTCYRWNSRVARHYFCSRCGIYVFHRKRAAPDHFGVNAFCLSGFDPTSVPVRATPGIGMTVVDPAARAEWPGPRELPSPAALSALPPSPG